MAFKLVILSAFLVAVNAGYLAPVATHYSTRPAVITKVANPALDSVATTHQNVVRSFGGTVSQYSKSVHTPYSSVHKEDTRVNNNVYTPTIAKTVTYTAPVVANTVSYSPAPAAVYTAHSAPVVTKALYTHQKPEHAVYASYGPQKVYAHEQQAHGIYVAPTPTAAVFTHQHEVPSTASTTYNHSPTATTYSHNSPAVSAYGSSQTVHYSPAEMVSHMSFDGFGTHWGF